MNKAEQKRVKQFLYSIKVTELAIFNLQRAIDDLDTRKASPPTWMSNPDVCGVSGGSAGSQQESWVEFLDAYPARRSFLTDTMDRHRRKVADYNETIDSMRETEQWGPLGADIIRLKYYHHIHPDQTIWCYHLFCSKAAFYRTHYAALRFFYEVLPQRFAS